MCKLAIGIQFEPNSPMAEILAAQSKDLKTQPHGIGAVVGYTDGKLNVYRDLTNYDDVIARAVSETPESTLCAIHTRISTHGTINLDNVHFFRIGNYLMAHNGHVMGYTLTYAGNNYWGAYGGKGFGFGEGDYNFTPSKSEKKKERRQERIDTLETILYDCPQCTIAKQACDVHKTQYKELVSLYEKQKTRKEDYYFNTLKGATYPVKAKSEFSDSYQFLQNIPKPITRDILAAEIVKRDFSGVAVIIDEKKRHLFLFSTRSMTVHTDFKTFSVFYSWATPESKIPNYEILPMIHVPVLRDNGKKFEKYETPAGVYEFDF